MGTVRVRAWARLVMSEASALVRTRFDLGALSTGRHRFYERLAWERWHGPTFVRREHDVVRTKEEDDGVMVLRFGPSRDIDLGATISCEAVPETTGTTSLPRARTMFRTSQLCDISRRPGRNAREPLTRGGRECRADEGPPGRR